MPSLHLCFPWRSGDELTEAGRLELADTSFEELFREINFWVVGLLKWKGRCRPRRCFG